MNKAEMWVYDKDHKVPVYVVAEEEGEFLVVYYFEDGGYMVSDWWDMDPFKFYKYIDGSDIGGVAMKQHIKYAFEADNYFAGGV